MMRVNYKFNDWLPFHLYLRLNLELLVGFKVLVARGKKRQIIRKYGKENILFLFLIHFVKKYMFKLEICVVILLAESSIKIKENMFHVNVSMQPFVNSDYIS